MIYTAFLDHTFLCAFCNLSRVQSFSSSALHRARSVSNWGILSLQLAEVSYIGAEQMEKFHGHEGDAGPEASHPSDMVPFEHGKVVVTWQRSARTRSADMDMPEGAEVDMAHRYSSHRNSSQGGEEYQWKNAGVLEWL